MKYYLVSGEGKSQINATRIDVRTSGTEGAKIYFVPSGASFTEESVVVDEIQVKRSVSQYYCAEKEDEESSRETAARSVASAAEQVCSEAGEVQKTWRSRVNRAAGKTIRK